MTSEDLLRTVDAIYAAASDRERWPQAISRIGGLIDAPLVAMLSDDRLNVAASVQAAHGWAAEQLVTYMSGYNRQDLLADVVMSRPVGSLISEFDHADPTTLAKDVAHNEFWVPNDSGHVLATVLFNEATRVTGLSFRRGVRQGPFQRRERDILAYLVPHLQRALQLHRQFASARCHEATLVAALNRVRQAVLIVDGAATIIHANAAALAVLKAKDGVEVTGGRVSLSCAAEHSRFMDVVASAAMNRDGGALTATRPSEAPGYMLFVSPIHDRDATAGSGSLAVVFLVDPTTRRAPGVALMRGLYGLTPAEAQLAMAIASGTTPRRYAGTHGVSINTVRSQLKQVFAKTSTGRQAQLVGLLNEILNGSPSDLSAVLRTRNGIGDS